MKQAVARTRTGLQERMEDLLSLARPVDESALEELESTLIASDIGVVTSQEIIGALRQQLSRQQIRDGAELRRLLKAEMLSILDSVPTRQHTVSAKPEVILMVGV
ncbi:MAG: signal recognition particle receptor subunit alpha, partial [Acidobacteriaceae bacterium]